MAARAWLFLLLMTGEAAEGGFEQPGRLPEVRHAATGVDGPHSSWSPRNKGKKPAFRVYFQAVNSEASNRTTSKGDRCFGESRVDSTCNGRIDRWPIDAGYVHEPRPGADGRPARDLGPFRTFPPGVHLPSPGGSDTRNLSASTDPDVAARVEKRKAENRIIPVPPGFEADLGTVHAPRLNATPRSAWSETAMNSLVGLWSRSATDSDDRVHQRIGTELLVTSGSPNPAGGFDPPSRLSEMRRGAAEPDGPALSESDDAHIVVTAQRPRSAILEGVRPEIELGPEDITGFGAGTVGELLDQLSPQTTGSGSPNARPLVLINGQRATGLDEIRSLPPEAVLRIEILPEHVALRYGRRPGNKVVNLVLQPNFKAVTPETSYGATTEDGRSLGQVRVNVARISPFGRWSLDALYARESPLTEDERPLAGDLGTFRTLLPSTQRFSLGGSFTRNLSTSTDLNVNARLEQSEAGDRIGPVPAGFPAAAGALRRNSTIRSASLGAALNGAVGSWSWSATGSYDFAHQRIETEFPAPAGLPTTGLVRSTTHSADLELLASGELATLPAGPISVSLGGRFAVLDYRNRSSFALVPGPVDLSRRTGAAQVNFEIPLLDGSLEGLAGIGELSANLNLNVEHVSGFGTLEAIGAGLRWAPARWISLNLSASERESAPDPQSLGGPAVLFPNVRTFDFASGKTVDILRIDGGNPDLRTPALSSFSAELSLRPLPARNLLVTASYTRSRTSDPVGALSVALPEFEAAFPQRFLRAADGRLVSIDARAVSFARSERDELRWGFSFFRNFRAAEPRATEAAAGTEPPGAEAARAAGFDLNQIRRAPANPSTLQLALYHSWRLRDRLHIREGVPAIDFLEGAPAGLQGGAPRHRLDLQAAVYRGGLGIRLTGSWQDGTRVRVEDRTLSYGSLARFDLRLFADLGEQQRLVSRAPWLRGTRVSFDVGNILDARPRVRDETGLTPLGLQPSYLDPAGRSVRIVLRKLF